MAKSLKGGARPGAGAKLGQHRIAHGELRVAIEKALGISYVEMLAQTQLKLFNDFRNNDNVRDYIRFTESISNRILQNQTTEVSVSQTSELTSDELNDKLNNILAYAAISEPIEKTDDDTKA